MLKYAVALCLVLAPTAVIGNEIDGLDSRAVDISPSFTLGAPFSAPEPGQYGAAFASIGADGRPEITIQSRYTIPNPDRIACSTTIALPRGTTRISHPALTSSGYLFVSVRGPEGWKLYARRRVLGLGGAVATTHCQGWTDFSWHDLGAPPAQPIASAPDAVAIGAARFTYVFVTLEDRRIAYRMLTDIQASRSPSWSNWQTLGAREVRSKPAVALYTDSGGSQIHLFWLDSAGRRVNHVRMAVDPETGRLREVMTDGRDFGYDRGRATARTACSAGPQVTAPGPLFVVCGSDRGRHAALYSIARYNPNRGEWGEDGAVEMVRRRPWISRDLVLGGSSAPMLGPSGLSASPLMFVAFNPGFCPEERGGFGALPGRICVLGPVVIQDLYLGAGSLSDWEVGGPTSSRSWASLN